MRWLINNGVMSLDFLRSERNLADHLSNLLAKKLVSERHLGEEFGLPLLLF